MAGYNSKDPYEKRVRKAHYFAQSMMEKGQARKDAYNIACVYYHVNFDDVIDYEEDPDEELGFFIGAHFIEFREVISEGDLC